jgi:hypothetical protein
MDDDRVDVGLGRGQFVNRDLAGPPRRLHHSSRQQAHAQTGGYAAKDPVNRAEIEPADRDATALGQDRLEPLAVGAAWRQDHDLELPLRDQLAKRPHRTGRDDDELLPEDDLFLERWMTHWAANERAVETPLEHVFDELAGS